MKEKIKKTYRTIRKSIVEYTITNQLIKPEPYNIKVIFSDLSLIKNAIIPAPNSQQAGSIILRTKSAPTQDLNAALIVTKGVKN